jgi:hypothetical protein
MLCCATRALAQVDGGAPTVRPAEPVIEGERADEVQLREPGTAYRWQPPAAVGSCLGGTCGTLPPPSLVAPRAAFSTRERSPLHRRLRFAYAGAIVGVVSAGIVLGSAIAIAVVDDVHSERITRGAWLGTFALSTGVVALSSGLARRELRGASSGSKAARNLGWTAFALALADGAILWGGAFKGFDHMQALTIGAGAIGAFALLPHALDAYLAGRGLRARQMVSVQPAVNGLRVRF